ncbi:imidazole glycerol phosphate synthase subunit HisH [[Clostridium] hylemonae]|uniref:imidazole glycerol phosphate synthase subunit HisH n=1 Tax=[Clostridium] hylemonae TaxID=89153 RepID=UPI001105CDA3|nr:imidazole glycerol phosphate synthase subunit HisH [[Clostridium] hylemonae]
MIAILDYGIGNLGSIKNMLNKIGEETSIASSIKEIEQADKLILPGVGSFDNGMKCLRKKEFDKVILEQVCDKKKPILGICLGMQMLGRKSEEGEEKGLDLISFDNKRFNFVDCGLKVPHMGWNYVDIINKENNLVKDIEEKQRYYFVHSYHAVCDSKENILMTCNYGYEFAAAVIHGNIYGTQFHPEKSHKFGMKLLENFAKEC